MDKQVKKIIPCIDIKDGKAVKGINFAGIKEVGNVVSLAQKYANLGADEIVLLDISATTEKRKINREWIKEAVEKVNVPFIVGGGISSVKDAQELFDMGVKRISVGSAAIRDPNLINELVKEFGSEAIVAAIDAKNIDKEWMVFEAAGTVNSGKELMAWAEEVQNRGVGMVLFTSMNHDGEQKGYPLNVLANLKSILSIPLIASGGAGSVQDFYYALVHGKVDAVLAASVFHFNLIDIDELKFTLWRAGVDVDLTTIFRNLNYDDKGLIPAIIQDVESGLNLMLGYMNAKSLQLTLDTKKVTFWSRSRNKLWVKGEESGHFLNLYDIRVDCDRDALLLKARPVGPTCHTGSITCWREKLNNHHFLQYLEDVLNERRLESPDQSYTAYLYTKGSAKIAQKVGEEAVELVIEAMRDRDDLFLNEAADLLYHYIVLLLDRGYSLTDVVQVLQKRHKGVDD